jgi:hypothetical protein
MLPGGLGWGANPGSFDFSLIYFPSLFRSATAAPHASKNLTTQQMA